MVVFPSGVGFAFGLCLSVVRLGQAGVGEGAGPRSSPSELVEGLSFGSMTATHDAESLALIATNSAVASRAAIFARLGRNDVVVSCKYPR